MDMSHIPLIQEDITTGNLAAPIPQHHKCMCSYKLARVIVTCHTQGIQAVNTIIIIAYHTQGTQLRIPPRRCSSFDIYNIVPLPEIGDTTLTYSSLLNSRLPLTLTDIQHTRVRIHSRSDNTLYICVYLQGSAHHLGVLL